MNETELKKLEDRLWAAADKMRGAVSVADYKFIVLGLIFLKYISDSFEERYKELTVSDMIKNQYALENNILLYRIPYWEKDNINLELLFNDKYLVKSAE